MIQFGLIALVIGIIIIIIRVIIIKRYFENGIEVNGEVTQIWRFRDRGRIYFTFWYKDLIGDNSSIVHFNRMTKTFLPHKQIRVLMKPNDPLKAIIKDLFQ